MCMYERGQAFIQDRHRYDRERRTDVKKSSFTLCLQMALHYIYYICYSTEMLRYVVQEKARFKIPGSLPKHRHC